jgi:hypothetical protein
MLYCRTAVRSTSHSIWSELLVLHAKIKNARFNLCLEGNELLEVKIVIKYDNLQLLATEILRYCRGGFAVFCNEIIRNDSFLLNQHQ